MQTSNNEILKKLRNQSVSSRGISSTTIHTVLPSLSPDRFGVNYHMSLNQTIGDITNIQNQYGKKASDEYLYQIPNNQSKLIQKTTGAVEDP